MFIFARSDADGGGIVRFIRSRSDWELHGAPDPADHDPGNTVPVDFSRNEATYTGLRRRRSDFTVVGGVLKDGGSDVPLAAAGDDRAAAAFLDGLTGAQRNALRAGARAVVTGLNANSTDVEKAIGYVALRIMRLEDG